MTEESPSPSSFSGDSSVLRFWQFFRQESSHLLPSLLPPVRFFDIHVASRLPRQLELWHRLFRARRGGAASKSGRFRQGVGDHPRGRPPPPHATLSAKHW